MRDCRCNLRRRLPLICDWCEFRLASSDPWIALADVAALAGASRREKPGGSVEDLYASEVALLATQRVIPLFHLPVSYAASVELEELGAAARRKLDSGRRLAGGCGKAMIGR